MRLNLKRHKLIWLSFLLPWQVGLGLSYATPIIGLLSDLMTSFTETEKEMVSVERVQQVVVNSWRLEYNCPSLQNSQSPQQFQ